MYHPEHRQKNNSVGRQRKTSFEERFPEDYKRLQEEKIANLPDYVKVSFQYPLAYAEKEGIVDRTIFMPMGMGMEEFNNRMLRNMLLYGDVFLMKLSALFRVADRENMKKLYPLYRDIISEYGNYGKTRYIVMFDKVFHDQRGSPKSIEIYAGSEDEALEYARIRIKRSYRHTKIINIAEDPISLYNKEQDKKISAQIRKYSIKYRKMAMSINKRKKKQKLAARLAMKKKRRRQVLAEIRAERKRSSHRGRVGLRNNKRKKR